MAEKTINGKKLALKIYAWLFVILFVIMAATFIIRYPILGFAFEESLGWEIVKWLFGYVVLAVIIGGIAYTPIIMYVQRKVHGLIK